MTRKSNLPPGSGFKKGKSGNPNGRPKGRKNMSTVVREILEAGATKELQKYADKIDLPNKQIDNKTVLVIDTFLKSLKGSESARKLLFEYFDGKRLKQDQDINITGAFTVTKLDELSGAYDKNRKKTR